jgi:hypothetical protein
MVEDLQLDGGRSENIVEDSLFGAEDDVEPDEIRDGFEEMDTLQAGVSVEYLTDLKDCLKLEIAKYGRPKIYQDGSFWYRPRDAVFALEAARQSASGISPRELYYRDVFVWLPGLRVSLPGEPNTLSCPTPECSGTLRRKS